MSECKSWRYPINNKYVEQFDKLFEGHDVIINNWYKISNDTFIYINNKFYYHIAKLKKEEIGFYFDDWLLNKKGELKYNKYIGYFTTKEDLKKFLNSKSN